MFLLDLLLPGLGQYRRGQRLVGLVFGVSAVAAVLFMYFSNQHLLYLHRDLRELVPRSATRELWAEKEAHKARGLEVGLALLLLSALDNLLAAAQRRGERGRSGSRWSAQRGEDPPAAPGGDSGGVGCGEDTGEEPGGARRASGDPRSADETDDRGVSE